MRRGGPPKPLSSFIDPAAKSGKRITSRRERRHARAKTVDQLALVGQEINTPPIDPVAIKQKIAELKVKLGAGAPAAVQAELRGDVLALTSPPNSKLILAPQQAALEPKQRPQTRLNNKNLLQLIKTSEEIAEEDALSADSIGYMARILIQTNLPHRDPGDVVAWNRRNGDFLMQISPGVSKPDKHNQSRRLGIPFGTYPRLILSWVTTEALRTKNPELFLGNSLRDFMRGIELQCTGGEKGTLRRLKEQMTRLFGATIAWSYKQGNTELEGGIRPFEGVFTFWDPTIPDQTALFPSRLLLNHRLFEEILRASVPLDMRVVRKLAQMRSSLGIDLYGWLTYKQHFLRQSGKPVFVSWLALSQQFGSDYAEVRFFKRDFKPTLNVVRKLYPDCNATATPKGLFIRPGKPHIAARALRT